MSAQGAVVISELDIANNKIEIVNTGGSSVDTAAWWLCNRVNGSPFYITFGSVGIIAAESSSMDLNLGAGEFVTLQLTAGFVPDGNGELGIYNTNSFASSTAIEDYVVWGAIGVRDSVAQNAGIWTDNQFIDVSGIGAGETVQLLPSQAGNAPADYTIGASTIGSATNVPEPGSALLAVGGSALLLCRRRS
ncbi:hypothetical protein JIN81_18405 [Haloferula rosea]|uniref:LTD domain-containing protein n=2 Tax=Haloferula rosea TaxID=490093 RepID=A0A934RH16_9BACT|nr:hypothetical protein [Haloferula rosea]